jgi:hypothetical protein
VTVTPVRERPTTGATHSDAAVVTVGRYADGRPARLTVAADGRSGGRAEHLTVYGDTRSGVTTVLHNITTAALLDGWETTVVDPDADTMTACALAFRDEYEQGIDRIADGPDERAPRLFLVDNLQTLIKQRRIAQNLAQLAAVAGPAGITVVVGTHDISLSGFGGRYRDATLPRAALSQHLLTLRASDRPLQQGALCALGVDMNRFGPRLAALAPGTGFLPRVSAQPIYIHQP